LARKILLADDSVTAQNMGRKILADAGYEVLTVNNGSAALKKVADSKPDLIVLDVYMPGYSGLEVCQRLKEVSETARIPILLTVGKLEPFKPEEAKRVRADAFIVKPFEASELLSVLTKLEDKIVPRAESSKPGRFARAIAVVEEGRYDKTMAAEDDSGWKDRIAFPTGKKKKSAEPEDVDDPAIYNPINKDLRTILDRKPAHAGPEGHEAKAEAAKLDLGALAPDGLPKDVTPEEIAALAAAAAQIKGNAPASDEKGDHGEESRIEANAESQPTAEASSAISQAEVKAEAGTEAVSESKTDSPEIQTKQDLAQAEGEERDREKIEAAAQDANALGAASNSSASDAEASPIAPATFLAADAATEAARDRSDSFSYATAPEPATMAAAAGAGSTSSRWTAVSVALLPEDSAISLEHEMQKAHAAFAAAEMAQVSIRPSEASIAWAPPAAIQPQAAAESLPEASLIAKASEAAESISAVVRDLEARAAALLAEEGASNGEPVASYLRPAESAKPTESASANQPQTEISESAVVESVPTSAAPEAEAVASAKVESDPEAEVRDDSVSSRAEESKPYETASGPTEFHPTATAESQVEELASAVSEVSDAVSPARIVERDQNLPPAETTVQDVPSEAVASSADEPTAMALPEKEDTAVSHGWRQIRDLTEDSAHAPAKDDTDGSKDSAAMAVAAGAEHAPQGVPAPESGESSDIANIVDSVLADLRPRIVAEISKKMSKKK